MLTEKLPFLKLTIFEIIYSYILLCSSPPCSQLEHCQQSISCSFSSMKMLLLLDSLVKTTDRQTDTMDYSNTSKLDMKRTSPGGHGQPKNRQFLCQHSFFSLLVGHGPAASFYAKISFSAALNLTNLSFCSIAA